MVVVSTATHDRLRTEAARAAQAAGFTARDLKYGFFASDHFSAMLEAGYRAHEEDPPSDASDTEPLTMVSVSFTPSIAEELQARADAAAMREGLGAESPGYSDFVERYMGRCLEAAVA